MSKWASTSELLITADDIKIFNGVSLQDRLEAPSECHVLALGEGSEIVFLPSGYPVYYLTD